MNIESLIGQIFQEKELFELLLFDIEENYDLYAEKNIHVYFDRVGDSKIKINEIVYFNSGYEQDQKSRSMIEKKEWYEIAQNENHYNLLLIRFDRTGWVSSIFKDHTRTHDWCHGWLDENPNQKELTPDDIRQGILELCGFFEEQQAIEELKSKKAV